jgi:hypothetical protein
MDPMTHAFFTSVLDGGEWSDLPAGKQLCKPVYRKLRRPQGLFRCVGKEMNLGTCRDMNAGLPSHTQLPRPLRATDFYLRYKSVKVNKKCKIVKNSFGEHKRSLLFPYRLTRNLHLWDIHYVSARVSSSYGTRVTDSEVTTRLNPLRVSKHVSAIQYRLRPVTGMACIPRRIAFVRFQHYEYY